MVKTHVEVSYTLAAEPSDFAHLDTLNTRTVYLWSDKRALLEQDRPWQVYRRASNYDEEPAAGFVEFWQPTIDENPPKDVDDIWTEQYKSLAKEKFTLEWTPSHMSLRVAWDQTEETLLAGKILAAVQQELQRLGLDPPQLPQVQQSQVQQSQVQQSQVQQSQEQTQKPQPQEQTQTPQPQQAQRPQPQQAQRPQPQKLQAQRQRQ